MKSNLLLLMLVSLLITGKLFAQDALAMSFPEDAKKTGANPTGASVFEFRASEYGPDLNAVPDDMISKSVLGETIARKLYLLDSKYTYQVPIVPGNPQTRTMIRKPAVYEAVKKIEHSLKKSVKKGKISVETASGEFNKVLDVAFNILTADTEKFEKAISSSENVDELTTLFTKRVTLVF